MQKFYVRKVAVLGAGVMGAQIAAHFANASVSVVLFDLKTNLVETSLKNLQKLNPKPFASNILSCNITSANYDDNLDLLHDCQLIIEAIAERIDWKEELYHKIAPYIHPKAIIASNTSGLSINTLASSLPKALQAQFCGIHFFNPPRYMSLVELIPHNSTADSLLISLEEFLVSSLGKEVVIARDTPNFIANRLGVFSMLLTAYHTQHFNLPLDLVDKLTGKELARAKSATYRTLDIVGIDVFSHVVKTMQDRCADGFEVFYNMPQWLQYLLDNKHLGQKTKAGCYKKDSEGLKVFNILTNEYDLASHKPSEAILEILKQKDWQIKFELLRNSELVEAQFLWACFRDLFHYAALMLGEIASNPRDMDIAIRSGFAWKYGIFELWQLAGWHKVASWINDDIINGKTIVKTSLPKWVFDHMEHGIYHDNKYFDIDKNLMVSKSYLPIYDRQIFKTLVLNEVNQVDMHIIYENSSVKLWHTGDNIGILSFKTKMCTIGMDVLSGIEEAINIAEEKLLGIVIYQEADVFSAGANLEEFGFSFMMNGEEAIINTISQGHRIICKKIRYSTVPIVAAVKGYTFGGGCEIMLHCDAVVANLESYIGLVEAGVGLLPGWGGTTEMAYRASLSIDPWKDFEKRYKNLALAKVATSAIEAKEMGFLRDTDTIILSKNELLYVAKEKLKFLVASGYRPMIEPKFQVFGRQGIANVNGLLENMIAGKQISEHDLLIAQNIAYVMCGGLVDKGSIVSEDWVLKLEAQKFRELAVLPKTSARIEHMLTTGKPLRN